MSARNWNSDNELRNRNRARTVFIQISLALNNIEIIADSGNVSPALRAELDTVTEALLDNARLLAENKIAEATSAVGRPFWVRVAESELQRGDANRSVDQLRRAARAYGEAWRYASFVL